ncbi:MAG TPA: TlpA disulfide reductase family protein [Pyrinomonadaceae bacterium]|nr:TlpA disulfide reductase family protein [Pyrinomonadaceae bacterium]
MKTIKHFLAVASILVGLSIAATAQTSLTSLNGGTVDVQAQRGKVVILAVGASWLPLSGKQAEYTNSLVKKYAGKNVAIFFIATDSTNPKSKNYATDDQLRQWATGNRLSVPILRDSDGSTVLKKFAIDQLPSFVILDKNGSQSGEAFGGIDPKFDITIPISKKVDSLL